ncbi:MAG TPA: lysophospholipid acyltransferase family protein [Candidatus Binatia bacterium]|jgi:KDO2-lipid IV(A) lauroyltransferase
MALNKKKKKRQGARRLLRPLVSSLDWLRYRSGEYSLRGFVRLLPSLPPRTVSVVTSALARATFLLLWKYRQRMEQNLGMAMAKEFPSHEQRQAVVRRAWRNFAQGLVETATLMRAPKERLFASIAIEGEEHLKRALAKGKGVIALTAHLGNFTIIGARLHRAGYSFAALVKQPRDPRMAQLMDDYRLEVGVKTIRAKPRREAARGILKALRAKSVVLLIADEFKSGGVPVEFFGRTSPAPRGPATLALRTGAATVPMFMIRDPDDRLTLYIEPEIELIKTDDLDHDVAANTALFTRCLEAMIRRHPDQWNWLGFQRDGMKPRRRGKGKKVDQPGVEQA